MPDMPPPVLHPGAGPFSDLAPDNPSASAKPMNEASDLELCRFLSEDFGKRLLLSWSASEAAARKLLSSPNALTAEQFSAALSACWDNTFEMLRDLDVIEDHLRDRVLQLRVKGILSGDPREEKFLEVKPPEGGLTA